MPTISVANQQFEADENKRLVLAIEEAGIDILHRCGGWAGCTTCRVEFVAGEPNTMTEAEKKRLERDDLLGKVRLSCQILCDHDMAVKPLMRVSSSEYDEAGNTPKDDITPDPVWIEKP